MPRHELAREANYSPRFESEYERDFRMDGGVVARCVAALERAVASGDDRMIRLRRAELRRYGIQR